MLKDKKVIYELNLNVVYNFKVYVELGFQSEK